MSLGSVKYLARRWFNDADANNQQIPNNEYDLLAVMACDEIARRTMVIEESTTFNATAGTAEYNAISGAFKIYDAFYKISGTDTNERRLQVIDDRGQFRKLLNNNTTNQGYPQYVGLWNNKIRIGPPPSFTLADAFTVSYYKCYPEITDASAAVTQASAAVADLKNFNVEYLVPYYMVYKAYETLDPAGAETQKWLALFEKKLAEAISQNFRKTEMDQAPIEGDSRFTQNDNLGTELLRI